MYCEKGIDDVGRFFTPCETTFDAVGISFTPCEMIFDGMNRFATPCEKDIDGMDRFVTPCESTFHVVVSIFTFPCGYWGHTKRAFFQTGKAFICE